MKKKNPNPAECFQQLSPVLKTMVHILAIQASGLMQKDMITCLNTLGLTDEKNLPFVLKTIQPLVKELEQQGLVIKKPKGRACPETLRPAVVQDAVLAGQFQKISLILLRTIPFHKLHTGLYFRKIEEVHRALQMAVYGGETYVDIDEAASSGAYYFSMDFRENHPFLVLFNRPFNPLVFDCIDDPKIKLKTLEYILAAAEKNLEPAEDALEYCVQMLSKTPNLLKKQIPMACLLFRGKIKLHQKLAGKFKDSPAVLAQMGWSQMLCGNNDGALNYFKNSLATIKKNTRKRKISKSYFRSR